MACAAAVEGNTDRTMRICALIAAYDEADVIGDLVATSILNVAALRSWAGRLHVTRQSAGVPFRQLVARQILATPVLARFPATLWAPRFVTAAEKPALRPMNERQRHPPAARRARRPRRQRGFGVSARPA